jgi:hypothetical protein
MAEDPLAVSEKNDGGRWLGAAELAGLWVPQ